MKRLVALTLAGMITGCGSLDVTVDIIDPGYVQSQNLRARLQAQLRQVLQPVEQRDREVAHGLAAIKAVVREEIAKTLGDPKLTSQQQTAIAQGLEAYVESGLQGFFDDFRGDLQPLDSRIRELASEPSQPIDIDSSLGRELTARLAVVDEFNDFLCRELQFARKQPSEVCATDAADDRNEQAVLKRLEQAQKSYTAGFGLEGSADAYAVASAPDRYWEPAFNRTYGRGLLGDLNFAVKMNGPADFTIKGLTFDPSEVARVASKVTTQGLLIAAQVAGVPVTGISGGGEQAGGELAASSDALAELENESIARAARLEAQRQSLIMIGRRIVGEEARLVGEGADAATRQSAIEALDIIFNSQQAVLNIQPQD